MCVLYQYNSKLASSNNMIANFTVADKLCKKHNLPEAFICLASDCKSHSLLCSNCVKSDHPHLASVHTLPNFIAYFSEFVGKAKERLEMDRSDVSIAAVVKVKKQEVEQFHLELLERMIRKLSEEKKAVLQSLDQLEREFREKEAMIAANQQSRSQIINYLVPFAQSSELLELKLKISSGWALTRLKEYLSELESLTNTFNRSAFSALQTSAITQANQKLEGTLFRSLSQLLRDQSMLMKPPLPEKAYHFTPRRAPFGYKLRPSSSCELKSGTSESGSTKAKSLRQFE